MIIVLYRVGRNLNRAYRTAEAFGIETIVTVQCSASLTGNLFKAANRVQIITEDTLPIENALALETFYDTSLYNVNWNEVEYLVLGGETSGLPRKYAPEYRATIPMQGKISGLTVEAALAIGLYEWRRNATHR